MSSKEIKLTVDSNLRHAPSQARQFEKCLKDSLGILLDLFQLVYSIHGLLWHVPYTSFTYISGQNKCPPYSSSFKIIKKRRKFATSIGPKPQLGYVFILFWSSRLEFWFWSRQIQINGHLGRTTKTCSRFFHHQMKQTVFTSSASSELLILFYPTLFG